MRTRLDFLDAVGVRVRILSRFDESKHLVVILLASLLFFNFGEIVSIATNSLKAQEVDTAGLEPGAVIKTEFVLEKIPDTELRYIATGDIGGVTAGQRVILELSIENPFDDDIPFSKWGSSCACTDIKITGDSVFKRKSITRISLKYLVPPIVSKGKLKLEFGFLDSKGRNKICDVVVTGYLKGFIDIGPKRKVIEVTPKLAAYQTEVHFTEPVTPDSLEIELCDKLRDVQFSVDAYQPGVAKIDFTVPFGSLPEKGVTGNVKVIHRPTATSRDFEISFVPRHPVVFSPSWLSFCLDGKQEKYVANAILQIRDFQEEVEESENSVSSQSGNDVPKPEDCRVEAELGGKSIEVDVQRMNRGFWRLKIFLDKNAVSLPSKLSAGKRDETILFKIKAAEIPESTFVELTVPFLIKE
jgi:hypothetical protein